MKRVAVAFGISAAIISTSSAFAGSQASFMPDNDLWKQDNQFNLTNSMTEELFNQIITIGMEEYAPIAKANKESLIINRRWTDSTVNANVQRSGGKVTINMYGGLARRDEVIPEGFALVLCHELGHAYGGEPYIRAASKIAAEGQSDYYGTLTCLHKVLPRLDYNPQASEPNGFGLKKCADTFPSDEARFTNCVRSMNAGFSLGKLLSVLNKEAIPQYETPDLSKVTKTNTSYPKTTQCRLDSYHAGTFAMARPACWFKAP